MKIAGTKHLIEPIGVQFDNHFIIASIKEANSGICKMINIPHSVIRCQIFTHN